MQSAVRAAAPLDWHPPVDTHANETHEEPSMRASVCADALEDEYKLVVQGIEPKDVWHAGFLRSWEARQAAATPAIPFLDETPHADNMFEIVSSPAWSPDEVDDMQ
jgi:hypothetical protein